MVHTLLRKFNIVLAAFIVLLLFLGTMFFLTMRYMKENKEQSEQHIAKLYTLDLINHVLHQLHLMEMYLINSEDKASTDRSALISSHFRNVSVAYHELSQNMSSYSTSDKNLFAPDIAKEFLQFKYIFNQDFTNSKKQNIENSSMHVLPSLSALMYSLQLSKIHFTNHIIHQKRLAVLSYDKQKRVATVLIFATVITLALFIIYIINNVKRITKLNQHLSLHTQMIDQSNDAVFITNKDLCITFWNKGAELLYGFSSDEAIGVISSVLLRSSLKPEERKKLLEISNTTKGYKGESTYLDKYNTEKKVIVSKATYRDIHNNIIGYTTVHTDISKLKDTEKRLRSLNSDLGKMVENETAERMDILDRISDGVSAMDNKLVFTYINEKACEILGIKKEDLLRRNLLDVFPNFEQTETFKCFTLAINSKIYQQIVEYFPPLEKHIKTRIFPGEKGISIFISDVSASILSTLQEEKIRLQDIKYRNLFNQAPDGIFVANHDKVLIDVNPKACELSGYSKEELMGMRVEDLFYPEDLETLPIAYEELLAGNSLFRQRRFKRKDNTELFIEINTRYYPEGKFVGFARDVSERKKMLDQILESEGKFKSIVDNEPECVKILNQYNEVIDMNPKGLEMLEADSAHDVLGQNVLQLVKPEYRQAFEDLTKQVFNGISGTLEFEAISLKNTPRWMSTHATPIFNSDGTVQSYLAITRDVTREKNTQKQLAQLAERNERTLQTMMDGYILADINRNIIDVNNAYCKMIGYTRSELLGMNIHQLEAMMSEELMEEMVQTLVIERYAAFETIHKRKDSSKIDVRINITITEVDNTFLFAAFVHDITESKKANNRLKEAYEKLRSLSAHLHKARENERKAIARDLHDELGQQITAFLMDLAWIKKNMQRDEKSLQKVNDLQAMATQFVKATRRLHNTLRPGVLHEMGLASAIEKLSQDNEQRSGIKFQFTDHLKGIKIEENIAINIYRIAQEAMNNIIKHSKATEVICETIIKNQHIMFQIRDNGVGLDEHTLASNSGHGLIGIQERVNSVGGYFKIEGANGEGTNLKISVPLKT